MMNKSNQNNHLIIGIDASRIRSGGGLTHLVEIIAALDPSTLGIETVHLWSSSRTLKVLPERKWLVKHSPRSLNRSLFFQLTWQFLLLKNELIKYKCDILFSVDASSICTFTPMVVLSQDMLSYEPGVKESFGWGMARLRLEAILYVQNLAFRRSKGVIFLTEYASRVIQKSSGKLNSSQIIPHGISPQFFHVIPNPTAESDINRPLRCLYISPISKYKHQWNVVEAIAKLRLKGVNINLDLIGSDDGTATELLQNQLAESDPNKTFVTIHGRKDFNSLPHYMLTTDIFIFASSCENLPITLLEAMAAGLPIACSDRGPMPEVLLDAGVYFDPEDSNSILLAIQKLVLDSDLRNRCSQRARKIASRFCWSQCSQETFEYIKSIHDKGSTQE